jgi:3-hydroxyacyl-[acyl-carrier-protein] dehydratase
MKLKDDFFKINDFCQTATGMDYTIALNPDHFIYRAHFPKNPITPGVCIIQIVKELSEEILSRELFLKKINNVKFLNVVNPLENKEVMFSVSVSSEEEGAYKVGAVVSHANNQFAKLSLLFINQ